MKVAELPETKPPNIPSITLENERDSAFLQLGRDVHSVVLEHTQTMRDCVDLARSCFTIWSKNQGAIFKKLLKEAHNFHAIDSLNYLFDMLELTPILKKRGINYRHLAKILTRARTLLSTSVRVDPYCAWKVAAICGLKDLVKELLGAEMGTKIDPYGRGVLAYYALGGQLECIIEFLEQYPESLKNPQTLSVVAQMAAIGGHVPVLKYLRDKHGFKLNHVFPAVSEDDLPETLLTAAVSGGDLETVEFLKQPEHEIDRTIGVNLALIASDHGQWHLYDSLAEENDPIQDLNDAIMVAQDAARYGQLNRVLSLIESHNVPTEELVSHILNGGSLELFWHALNNNWFSLEDTFENGATVQHILARQGHLELLKAVLRDERALKGTHTNATKNKSHPVYVVDKHNQTLLHYAAAGGQSKVYSFLRDYFKDLPVDNFGSTIAHCAAGAGSVWFLKTLFNGESGPELIRMRDNSNATILHDAGNNGEPNILTMIVDEFGIDPQSLDKQGRTVLQILEELAQNDSTIEDTIHVLRKRYYDQNVNSVINHSQNFF